MAAPRPKKRALSDRLKNMRFMKRHEESNLREKFLRHQEQREKDIHWTTETDGQPTQTTPIVLIEEGISSELAERRIGRQSFGNFNKAFEDHAAQPNEVDVENRIKYDHLGRDERSSEKEMLSHTEGIIRNEDSDSDANPLKYRRINLQGASKSITKKKRRPTQPLGHPGRLRNHCKNTL